MPKRVYLARRKELQIQRDTDDKTNGCYHTRELLRELKLGQIWRSQEVPDNKEWRKVLFEAIHLREETKWKDELAKIKNLRCYKSSMKEHLRKEDYLSLDNAQARKAITRLRLGSSEIELVHVQGRRRRVLKAKRICKYCHGVEARDSIMHEYHFLIGCRLYQKEGAELYEAIAIDMYQRAG